MPLYTICVVNEDKKPIQGITVEAVDLSDDSIGATGVTDEAGSVVLDVTGKHFFRPRIRRTSATVGERVFTGVVEVQVISTGGGGVGFCYDYLIDAGYTGTEGAVIDIENSTSTFKRYSTIQGAVDDAEAVNGSDGLSFFICAGDYSENVTITPGNLNSSEHLFFYGSELQNGVEWGNAISGDALTIAGSSGSGRRIRIHTVKFNNSASADSVDCGTSGIEIHLWNCELDGTIRGNMVSSSFTDCKISGLGFIPAGASTVNFHNCEFLSLQTNAMTWASGTNSEIRFVQCNLSSSDKPVIITGGTYNHIVFDDCRWNTSGDTPERVLLVNGNATINGFAFINCHMNQPKDANGSVYFQTFTAMQGLKYIDNWHEKATGVQNPWLTNGHSTAIFNSVIAHNSFGRETTGAQYNETEDAAKFSVSGKFEETIFGPNAPATVVH